MGKEPRLACERLLDFLESSEDPVAVVDWGHRIEYVNPAMRRAFGEPGDRRCHDYFQDRPDPCPWCENERIRAGEWAREEIYIEKVGRYYDRIAAPLAGARGAEGESSGMETGSLEPGGKRPGTSAKLIILRDVSESRRSEEALRRSGRELEVRHRISEIFLSVPEEQVYSEVLETILAAFESKYGIFGYIDEDGALVCPSMSRDVWSRCEVPEKSIVFPREKWGGIWGRSMVEKRTVCKNEGPLAVPPGHIPLDRALCVPIISRGQLLGVFTVANKETDYTPEDAELLETIAAKVAAILQSRLRGDRQYRARRRAEEALAQLRRQLRAEGSFAGIVGRDPKMMQLFETIREVAAVDVSVLIQGESGTGKELVAAAIHTQGSRADGPFVPVNCSALPETLLESELFGHVRGSFTGAIRDKKGRFELADGGTIFLDEVGELSPPIQVSLLRVLQEGTIERVGDEQTRRVDVRVISATNRDLRNLVADGRFREDLFYRLCVVPIHVPPLRERRQDIPLLADHVLRQVCTETDRQVTLSPQAIEALCAHDWPGNVRELQNAIYYAVVKCKGSLLEASGLPPEITGFPGGGERPRKRGRKRKLDAESVERALRYTRGNRKEAARRLGVSRATLYKYFHRFGRG